MARSLLRFGVLLAIAVLLAACVMAPRSAAPTDEPRPPSTPTSAPAAPTVRVAPTPAPARMPTATVEGEAPEDVAGDPRELVAALGAIALDQPRAGQQVSSPLHLEGTASVFEATVEFEIVAEGRVLGRGFTTASVGAPERGSFAADLAFESPSEPVDGLLRVFSSSPKDGSVQNLVLVPLRLVGESASASETITLRVYFVRLADGQAELIPVERTVPRTQAVGRAALHELLNGPTESERAMGLDSPIPSGTQLRSLRIVDGVANADFDRQLQFQMGGSMRVQTIRDAIELTLLQFPSVERVVISVEGQTEGVLEP